MRTAASAAALLAAGLLLAGCSSGQDGTDFTGRSAASADTSTTAQSTPAEQDTTPAETTAPAAKSFAMGYRSTITQDGKGVLRLTVEKPRTVTDAYITPKQGRFLAVTVTYEALAPAQDINPFDLVVLTAGGERLDPTFGPDAGPQLDAATLNSGEKARGTVVFDVPKTGVVGIAYAPAGQVIGTWKL